MEKDLSAARKETRAATSSSLGTRISTSFVGRWLPRSNNEAPPISMNRSLRQLLSLSTQERIALVLRLSSVGEDMVTDRGITAVQVAGWMISLLSWGL